MAQTSWPFAEQDVDEEVSEEQWRDLHSTFASDGVVGNPGSAELQVFSASVANRQVSVRSGYATLLGHGYRNTAQVDFQLAANGTGSIRWDRVCLKWDSSEPLATRIRLVVKAGTAGGGPPALTRDKGAGIWEASLASVPVGPGVATITPSQVVDDREHHGVDIVPVRTVADIDPADRRFGMLAAEFIGGRLRMWSGSTWRQILDADSPLTAPQIPRGRLASASLSGGPGAGATQFYNLVGTPTVTVAAGRKLRVKVNLLFYSPQPGSLEIGIDRFTGGTQARFFGRRIWRTGSAPADLVNVAIDVGDDPPAGTHTYRVLARHSTSYAPAVSLQAGQTAELAIIDEGGA